MNIGSGWFGDGGHRTERRRPASRSRRAALPADRRGGTSIGYELPPIATRRPSPRSGCSSRSPADANTAYPACRRRGRHEGRAGAGHRTLQRRSVTATLYGLPPPAENVTFAQTLIEWRRLSSLRPAAPGLTLIFG